MHKATQNLSLDECGNSLEIHCLPDLLTSTPFPSSALPESAVRSHSSSVAEHYPSILPTAARRCAKTSSTHHPSHTAGNSYFSSSFLCTTLLIWQLPPPYIADSPTPHVVARKRQQPLTHFLNLMPTAQLTHPTARAAAPCTTPPPLTTRTPILRTFQTSGHRRRTTAPNLTLSAPRGTITDYSRVTDF